MLSRVQYRHDPFPVYESEEGKKLAYCLHEQWQYWRDASAELRTKVWPAADKAFLSIRTLPKAPGFNWVDKGDLGCTDVWDAVRLIVESILLSLMPRDESWLSPVAFETETQAAQNIVRDYLLTKHREGGTRSAYGIHLTQLIVRGVSAVTWSWQQVYGYQAVDRMEQMLSTVQPQVNDALDQIGELLGQDPATLDPVSLMPPELMAALGQPADRTPYLAFDGPIVRCLDMQDVFLDPASNTARDFDIPMCVLQYFTPEELTNATDQDGQPLYSNLKDLQTQTLEQIWGGTPNRAQTAQYLGIHPAGLSHKGGGKYIPVLVFHRQLQVCDSNQWVDSYFYVADLATPRLIRAHTNPAAYGRRCTYIDTFQDHYSNKAYGISPVEKVLPAWHTKNLIGALGTNAAVASVFPAMNVIAGLMIDERKPTASPGGFNYISFKPQVGPNFMAPVPTPNSGALLSMQQQQFHGQQILGGLGATGGSLGLDPSRNIEQSKTATQIDTESSSQSIGRDNLLEKVTITSLEPLCQAVYEAAFQYAEGDLIKFVADLGGEPALKEISKLDLKKPRRIVVTGYHGLQSKNQQIRNIKESLQALTQGNGLQFLGASGPLIIRDLLLRLLGHFGIRDLDKYKLPDLELIQQTPGGQQFIAGLVEQTAMQVMQVIGLSEEQAAQVMQVLAQGQQQGGQPQA